MRPSLILCIATYAIVGTTLLLMSSPTVQTSHSRLIGEFLYPFNIFTLFSGIFALGSVFLAASELKSTGESTSSLLALLFGAIFVVLYVVMLAGLLPVLAKQ